MFSGINQSSIFSNVNFMNSYWKTSGSSSSTAEDSSSTATTATEEEDSQQVSAREAFATVLKDKGMTDEDIESLPESVWKKAEKRAGDAEDYDFSEDKQLQKLADFLARKAELVKSEQSDTADSSDSASISQEALDAAAAAETEAAAEDEEAEESGVITTETEEEEADNATSLASIFDEFKEKLNQLLLEGVGLGNLSESGASSAYMSYTASFEISYSSMIAVADENGMTMQETSFSLKGSFSFMGIGSINSSDSSSFNPFDFLSGITGASDSTDGTTASDPFSQLQEYFSPEKTADRILDFALGFFGNSEQYKEGGNTEESRQSFADVIGAAIQKGFDQALGILGDLPDETADEVDETHSLVFDGLDNFVTTGSKDGEEGDEVEDPVFDFSAYSSIFEMNYSSTTTYYSAEETGDALEDLYNKYFNRGYQIPQYTNAQDVSNEAEQQEVSPLDVTA